MTLHITVKQAGRKRPLATLPFPLPERRWTLEELIAYLVRQNVAQYNDKTAQADLVGLLTRDAIDAAVPGGKVGFGRTFSAQRANPDAAVAAALLAFSDGLLRIFIDDVEVTEPDGALALRDGSTAAFVRLTFLSGRMW